MNVGKIFEKEFKDSVLKNDYYFLRLKDPAQSFNKSESQNLRFSLPNPYDCIIYSYPIMFALELKTKQSTSLTFWRKDFKKSSFDIKEVQIKGLTEASLCKGIVAGFVINFRKTEHTYFLDIKDFNNMVKNINKKSFNENDVINNNGYLIAQKKKKVRFSYDIENFISEYKERYNEENFIN